MSKTSLLLLVKEAEANGTNLIIHCDTKEKAQSLLYFMSLLNYEWYFSDGPLSTVLNYTDYGNQTCYRFNGSSKEVTFGTKQGYLTTNQHYGAVVSYNDLDLDMEINTYLPYKLRK